MTINISLSIVVALIVFIHALLFLVLILYLPNADKTIDFSLLLLLMIPLCIISRSYGKNYFPWLCLSLSGFHPFLLKDSLIIGFSLV